MTNQHHQPTPPSPSDQLKIERSLNESYVRHLAQRPPKLDIAQPRSAEWTGSGVSRIREQRSPGPIAGRVALTREDEDVGLDFYVGPYHAKVDGKTVVSWAAPVAAMYYDPNVTSVNDIGDVIATRTFVPSGDGIESFEDDPATSESLEHFSRSTASRLEIPAPPTIVRPKHPRPASAPTPTPEAPQTPVGDRSVSPPQGLRAESAVRRLTERPRSGRLQSILSTLQPDQYRLVTWPADKPLVIQGQPGTGKTIIAVHRAAWLVNPEGAGYGAHRVLVLGPTEAYRRHIEGALGALTSGSVSAYSIPSLLQHLANESKPPRELDVDEFMGTTHELGRAVDTIHRRLRRTVTVRELVNTMITPNPLRDRVLREMRDGEALTDWLRKQRSYESIRERWSALPFLTSVNLAVNGPRSTYQHIVIDEAQDVRPLEWRILHRLLAADGEFTILGDMNQRRSDHSYHSWKQLINTEELSPIDRDLTPELLTVGYRSTRQILRYANQLLPKDQRAHLAIRDGEEPTIVTRVPARELHDRTVELAVALAARHTPGVIAVIAITPRAISDKLRQIGWTRGDMEHSWIKDGSTVVVFHPENSRGLEFDGVVVIPDNFPSNLGREGLLYTSLTRATTELIVLASKPLPKALKSPRKA